MVGNPDPNKSQLGHREAQNNLVAAKPGDLRLDSSCTWCHQCHRTGEALVTMLWDFDAKNLQDPAFLGLLLSCVGEE